ncbi:MAG: glycosyltransferase family 4 protein, partial [Coriobacteriia bacterium]|nr:glycosyltransferase family 4 protein [Coriobacteriia bacterium]
MRIGFVADMYLPHVSGVTNHISLYKRYLESLGHEVFVLTFGDRHYEDAEPNVVRSPGMPWGSTGWRFALSFSHEAREIAESLDVIHVHHPFQSGRIAAPIAARTGALLAFTNHTRYDLYSDAYAWYVPSAVRYAYLRSSLSGFLRRCDLVVAPAASIAEWLADFTGFTGATVIPNGIDTAAFAGSTTPVPRSELGFADDDVVFCYVGRLGPEKNTPWLAEEFAAAASSCPRARLLVVGDGPSRADARAVLERAGVAERAHFTGMVPYDSVPDYEASADAFVTGSVSEVHPLVVLEAMAAGLPVVAVSSPGIADTVE